MNSTLLPSLITGIFALVCILVKWLLGRLHDPPPRVIKIKTTELLPRKASKLVHREQSNSLKRMITSKEGNVINLIGLSGSGKRTIMIELARSRYAKKKFSKGRYWIDFFPHHENPGEAIHDFLVKLIGVEEKDAIAKLNELKDDFKYLCKYLKRYLSKKKILFCLANVDAANLSDSELEELYLGEPAVNLVTTISPLNNTIGMQIEDKLTDEEAIKLLETFYTNSIGDRAETLRLVNRLGNFPLAIKITADLMRINKYTCRQVIEKLEQNSFSLKNFLIKKTSFQKNHNVAEAFDLLYGRLDDKSKLIFQLLGLCSNHRISKRALVKIANNEQINYDSLDHFLSVLNGYSLVDCEESFVYIKQPLFADYAEICARKNREFELEIMVNHAKFFTQAIVLQDNPKWYSLSHYDRCIKRDQINRLDEDRGNLLLAQQRIIYENIFPKRMTIDTTLGLSQYWFVHCGEMKLLDWAKELKLTPNLDMADKAHLLKLIGDLLFSEKKFEDSLNHYQMALRIYNSINDKTGQGYTKKSIGDLYRSINKKESDKFYKESLKHFHNYDLGRAVVFKAIGDLMQSYNYDDSIRFYSKAEALYWKENDTFGIAGVWASKGHIYKNQKKWTDAIKAYNISLDYFKEAKDDLFQAGVLKAIGDIITSQESSKKCYRKAIEYYTNPSKSL